MINIVKERKNLVIFCPICKKETEYFEGIYSHFCFNCMLEIHLKTRDCCFHEVISKEDWMKIVPLIKETKQFKDFMKCMDQKCLDTKDFRIDEYLLQTIFYGNSCSIFDYGAKCLYHNESFRSKARDLNNCICNYIMHCREHH